MKILLFNDGSAFFSERAPLANLVIELSCDADVYLGENKYSSQNGVAKIGDLAPGKYNVSVVCKGKRYSSGEDIIINDLGVAYVDDSGLWESVLRLKAHVESLTYRLSNAEKNIENHEERISGYSLFD